MQDSIYRLDGHVYSPTRWAGSPWSPSMQHGGPVIGIFAREAERTAADLGLQLARLTVDLFKPVPLEPLIAVTRIVRQGSRIAGIETALHPVPDGPPVSRATSLLLRSKPHPERFWETSESPPPPPDEAVSPDRPAMKGVALPPGFHERVDIRAGTDDAGPYVWLTTPLALVEGEAISPLQRAAALTDMTLGTQMRMAARRDTRDRRASLPGLMINTDTTVYWERPFVGAHLGLRPSLVTERDGIGAAEAILYDAEGRVGRSLQSALVQRMGS